MLATASKTSYTVRKSCNYQPEKTMVTLKDIAAEAGVSITTVSNVVHNRKSRVSPERVKKIWEIIEA